MADETAKIVWAKHEEWSAGAGRLKSRFTRWRTAAFILAVSGAFLETLSTQVPAGAIQHVFAGTGAACLLLIPILAQRFLRPKDTSDWTRARSVSERLKAEVYKYIAKASPYDEERAAPRLLLEKVSKIEDQMSDLMGIKGEASADPPDVSTHEAYIKERVADQIAWYKKKSRGYRQKADTLRGTEVTLAIAAAVFGAAAGFLGESVEIFGVPVMFGAWVAVLTTVGGTVTAHVAATRYETMVTSYAATASRLETLLAGWRAGDGGETPSEDWSSFVADCEHVIAIENESWMADWSESKTSHAAPAPRRSKETKESKKSESGGHH